MKGTKKYKVTAADVAQFIDYATRISYTNKYDNSDENKYMDSITSGYIEEVGEIAGKYNKKYRDNVDIATYKNQIAKELGDACWYGGAVLIACIDVVDKSSDALNFEVNVCDDFAFEMFLGMTGSHESVYTVGINKDIIEYSEYMKSLSDHHRNMFRKVIAGIIYMIAVIKYDLLKVTGLDQVVSLGYILNLNELKLAERYRTNKIHGSGDDR